MHPFGIRRRTDRDRRAITAALWLCVALAVGAALWGCGSLPPDEAAVTVVATQAPAAEPEAVEPTESAPTPTPPPTAAAIVVEAAPDAPQAESLGKLDVTYPVRMAPQASDTVILELSVPELLAAAEPVAVARVEEAEPISEDLGRYDAVIFLAPRMRAELTSPGLTVEALTPAEQPVAINAIDAPTSWAWTVQAPGTPGKQVLTLRLFRSGDDAPMWIGSLRVNVVSPPAAAGHPAAEETAPEDPVPPDEMASAAAAESQATSDPGVLVQVVQTLTQDVTGLILGLISLVGSIVAAVLAALIERGILGEGALQRKARERTARSGRYHPLAALRALWFRISERFRFRKR